MHPLVNRLDNLPLIQTPPLLQCQVVFLPLSYEPLDLYALLKEPDPQTLAHITTFKLYIIST